MFTRQSSVKKFVPWVLILVVALFAGCASNKNKVDSETGYYDSAQRYLEKRNFNLAIERLTELQSRFPFGRYSKASALDLIYAHYQLKDFTAALVEADRFTRLNADHVHIDYAYFVRAMSYFELYLTNRGIFGKVDPAVRSPEQGDKAFTALSNFVNTYPDSDYRQEALKAMVVLKDALARHELVVANHYIRLGAWIAAAERANNVVNHYPGVGAVGDAYVVLIEAYEALDLPEDKAVVLEKLTRLYPDHATLASGSYRAPKWEEDRWWVKALTLGLTS